MSWTQKSSKVVYENRFMRVTEEELVTGYGDPVTFAVVHKGAGVSVVPYDGRVFYLIRQYRYPVDFTGWEFPAGHAEHASIKDAALAELSEETGYSAGELTPLGSFFEAPGHLDQEIHVFLATGLTAGKQRLEPAEKGIVVRAFTAAQIDAAISAGEIKDGLTLAAWQYFRLYEGRHTL